MAVDYAKIEKMIILELQKELLGQGHKATGSLINSMEGQTMVLPDSVVIEILMDDYSQYVNDGRKPGGKKVPIAVLVDWIERKGIASGRKDIKNAALLFNRRYLKKAHQLAGVLSLVITEEEQGLLIL